LATKFPDFSNLLQVVDDIKSLITSQGHTPDVESVREVDRRLRICKNPEKVIGSKAYLARKLEDERAAEEKRNKKTAEMQGVNNMSDPFGNELSKTRQLLVDYDDDDDDD
jgi:cyclin H